MGANVNERNNGQLSLQLLSLMLGALIHSPLAADIPKPSDTATGGGMGGTGNTIEPGKSSGIIPLQDKKALACAEEELLGEYHLESANVNAQGGIRSMQPLCDGVRFPLGAKDRLEFRLRTGQEMGFESKGEGSIDLKRKTGTLGTQLEINVYATKESVGVRLNKDLLVVQEGYVGQIWIDGAQMFWGLRRTSN
jgi:hypothetical protein